MVAVTALLVVFACAMLAEDGHASRLRHASHVLWLPFESQAGNAHLDLAALERVLAHARIANDRLIIDTELGGALMGAVDALPPNADEVSFARCRFVLHKSLPGAAGVELANLFLRFYEYRRRQGAVSDSVDLDEQVAAHQQLIDLQQEVFGSSVSARLFGQERVLQQYIFSLRRLESDQTLTELERSERQSLLQRKYEDAVEQQQRF